MANKLTPEEALELINRELGSCLRGCVFVESSLKLYLTDEIRPKEQRRALVMRAQILNRELEVAIRAIRKNVEKMREIKKLIPDSWTAITVQIEELRKKAEDCLEVIRNYMSIGVVSDPRLAVEYLDKMIDNIIAIQAICKQFVK